MYNMVRYVEYVSMKNTILIFILSFAYIACRIGINYQTHGYIQNIGDIFIFPAFMSPALLVFFSHRSKIKSITTAGLFVILLTVSVGLYWNYMDKPWFSPPETNTCDGPCYHWFSFENDPPLFQVLFGGSLSLIGASLIIIVITGLSKIQHHKRVLYLLLFFSIIAVSLVAYKYRYLNNYSLRRQTPNQTKQNSITESPKNYINELSHYTLTLSSSWRVYDASVDDVKPIFKSSSTAVQVQGFQDHEVRIDQEPMGKNDDLEAYIKSKYNIVGNRIEPIYDPYGYGGDIRYDIILYKKIEVSGKPGIRFVAHVSKDQLPGIQVGESSNIDEVFVQIDDKYILYIFGNPGFYSDKKGSVDEVISHLIFNNK